MTSQKLKDLARKIMALEERELIYVLSHVLPEYSPYERDPETNRSGFFLGTFLYRHGALEMDIVAYPDPEVCTGTIRARIGACAKVRLVRLMVWNTCRTSRVAYHPLMVGGYI